MKAVLITGCDTGIGQEVARHLDMLGCHVFAACLDTASEGAQRLRVEASPRLKLVNMDVTREDHVRMAVEYIEENLPPSGL
jgi:NAD(P)-dependent dehydrogenase (short-subunit alcohol dehydrogenase family)